MLDVDVAFCPEADGELWAPRHGFQWSEFETIRKLICVLVLLMDEFKLIYVLCKKKNTCYSYLIKVSEICHSFCKPLNKIIL